MGCTVEVFLLRGKIFYKIFLISLKIFLVKKKPLKKYIFKELKYMVIYI